MLTGEQCESLNCDDQGHHVLIVGEAALWLCSRCYEEMTARPPLPRRPRRWRR